MSGDHDRLSFAVLGSQTDHHRGEDALFVAALAPVAIVAHLYRFQRLYRVQCRPYSLGASRHRKLLRLNNIISLNARPSSTRGLS